MAPPQPPTHKNNKLLKLFLLTTIIISGCENKNPEDLSKCVLQPESNKSQLRIEIDKRDGAAIKGFLFKGEEKLSSLEITCSGGYGLCKIFDQTIIGFRGTEISRESRKTPDRYLLPGISQYLSIINEDTETIRESEKLWLKSKGCDSMMRLVY